MALISSAVSKIDGIGSDQSMISAAVRQGFPDSYQIETGRGPDGEPVKLTSTAQGRMCGNSVCPPLAEALARANAPELAVKEAA